MKRVPDARNIEDENNAVPKKELPDVPNYLSHTKSFKNKDYT